MGEIDTLKRITLANMLWDNFNIDGKKSIDIIKELVPKCEPIDVFDLAIDAREQQKLRYIPLVLAVELSKYEQSNKLLSVLLPKIITRADMITDFLKLYWADGKHPLSNSVKKGLAESFHKFSEYQFAKYNRKGDVKLRDAMFMCHPKPIDDIETELYKRIASNTFTTPETWEVMLSRGDDKKSTWENLISSRKIGGMAMLRNIKNMVEAGVDHEIISTGIRKANMTMLTPMDFYKAYNMNPSFKDDIEYAMFNTYDNLPKLKGSTLFIVDVSGSMDQKISSKTNMTRLAAASAMATLAANQCKDLTLVCTSGDDCMITHSSKVITDFPKGFDLFKTIKETRNELGYGGIFTRQCLEWCEEQFKGKHFDRIIVFSDSQDCEIASKRAVVPFGDNNYICNVASSLKSINCNGAWTSEITGWSEYFMYYIIACENS